MHRGYGHRDRPWTGALTSKFTVAMSLVSLFLAEETVGGGGGGWGEGRGGCERRERRRIQFISNAKSVGTRTHRPLIFVQIFTSICVAYLSL